MSIQFYIGQIFEGTYPPEAAIWCNITQTAYIKECDDSKEGSRCYQIVAIPEKTEEELLQIAKNSRKTAIDNVVVTVDGMEFDGNEISQERISRAISVLKDNESILWVLHNNTVVSVTKEQLHSALRLAVQEQTLLWVSPYMEDSH